MKEIKFSNTISKLRKNKKLTQEQLATAINISPQAISKWEKGTSLPDIQTLPLIADYFNVSIDYLFYGQDISYGEIYEKIYDKVATHEQMSKKSYEDTLSIFGAAHHGISCGNIRGRDGKLYNNPAHISNENGISLLSGKGYGAIITRDFFENISKYTAELATKILSAISQKNNFLACMAIISMSDISFEELKEKLIFDDDTLRKSLDCLIEANIVIEKKSKHKALGYTYDINSIYHTCLCVVIATIEMQRCTLDGMLCCMGYGDFPINFS